MENEKYVPAMNNDEIQEYWDTLCSFKGENIEAEVQQLEEKIKLPRFLYKYRAVNNNNLEALRDNKIFFSQPINYDDPFDSFLHINKTEVLQELKIIFNDNDFLDALIKGIKENLNYQNNNAPKSDNDDSLKKFFVETIEKIINSYLKNQNNIYQFKADESISNDSLRKFFVETIEKIIDPSLMNLRSKVQEETLSICFSENGLNETLWLKYADMHKGFCIIYDMQDPLSLFCGKIPKCANCEVKKVGYRFYPIYYSNEPHNANNFIKHIIGKELEQRFRISLPESIKNKLKPIPWEIERNCLIKKECHHFDEEWRCLAFHKMKLPAKLRWIPYGVIIGLRTSEVDKSLIIAMAKEAGIKNIYQSYIDNDNELNKERIYLKKKIYKDYYNEAKYNLFKKSV